MFHNCYRPCLWHSSYCRKSHGYKMNLIREPWQLPLVAMNLASIEIQKIVRGFLVRGTNWNRESVYGFDFMPQISYKHGEYKTNTTPNSSSLNFTMYHVAAAEIQKSWKTYMQNKCIKHMEEIQNSPVVAAACIQRNWHRYKDTRLFRYYADLLRFRNQGDPAVLLKSINPREIPYFEKAARIHIRFRLGGTEFPPNIYYKVFTRGALCDVGSFAPREYTKVKPRHASAIHNDCKHPKSTICPNCVHIAAKYVKEVGMNSCVSIGSGSKHRESIRVGKSEFEVKFSDEATQDYLSGADGWYERVENNGWRLVTATTLEAAEEDPITKASNNLKTRYHFSKIKRQKDKTLARKLKRREWLRKLYVQGLPSSSSGVRIRNEDESKWSDRRSFIDTETKINACENDDGEVEDLLLWTKGLDYDDYLRDWSQLGTSASIN